MLEDAIPQAAEKVENIGGEISDVLRELDRRRKEIDWKQELAERPQWVGIAGLAAAGAVAGAVALTIRRRRDRRKPLARLQELHDAVVRALTQTEIIARPRSSAAKRLLSVVGSALVAGLLKSAAQRLLAPRLEQREDRTASSSSSP
jgi:hypothetical protein